MTFEEPLPRLLFANDPLRAAVAQVRFAATTSLREEAVLAEVARRLPGYVAANAPMSQMTVPFGPGSFAITQHSPAQFRDEAGTTIVSIAPDSVSLETTDYPGWDVFSAGISGVLDALGDLLPNHLTRVGLRYVNELMLPGAESASDWHRLLDPNMVAFAGGERIGARVRRSLEQLTLDMGDDAITLRHGFVSRGDLPEAATSSLYIFDVDAFSELPRPRDTATVMATLHRYHQWAWALFRGSIGDEVVAALGGEPA